MGQIHQMSISSKTKFMINRWIWDDPMGTKSQAISDQIQGFIQQSIGLSRLIGIKSIQNNAVPTPATIGSPKFGIRVCVHRYQVAEWPRTGDQPSLPWDYTSMNIICVSWSLNRFHMNLPYIYINIYQKFWRWNAKIQPAVKQKSTSMASAGGGFWCTAVAWWAWAGTRSSSTWRATMAWTTPGSASWGLEMLKKTMVFGGSWGCDDTLYSILFCTIVYIYILYTVMICYHYDHCSHTFLTVLIILTFLIVLVTLIVMMVISFIAYFFVVVIIL